MAKRWKGYLLENIKLKFKKKLLPIILYSKKEFSFVDDFILLW